MGWKAFFFHLMLSYLHYIRFIWHNLLTSTRSINTLECVMPQITARAVLFVVCVGICRTAQTLMNECFDLTATYEASDGWACFGLITGFTRGWRIAVNQGPHYKSCRLSRARSHPRLMSQRSRLFAVFQPRGIFECSSAFYCRVKQKCFLKKFQ